MPRLLRVATPPKKPLLVFDGDCGFCRHWIRRWRQRTGEVVEYLPAQDGRIQAQCPEIPRAQFDAAVQLIETDGEVFSGAEAVFRTLTYGQARPWPLRAYQFSPVFAKSSEWAYRMVANHRVFFSRLTRWL
jgi:predicted DCC family thiol-disulfide oxidoreductase YuxK